MATPTAAFRRRLETSPVYEVIPVRQRQTWVSACLALDEDSIRKRQDEEVFEQPDDCWGRLFNWSFTRGCVFVKGRHRGGAYLARWYNCKHHGRVSRNDRGLESEVRKDDNGQVVGSRSREGKTRAISCDVHYYLAFHKPANSLPDTARSWCGSWRDKDHTGHEDPINPLAGKIYKKILPDFHALEATA